MDSITSDDDMGLIDLFKEELSPSMPDNDLNRNDPPVDPRPNGVRRWIENLQGYQPPTNENRKRWQYYNSTPGLAKTEIALRERDEDPNEVGMILDHNSYDNIVETSTLTPWWNPRTIPGVRGATSLTKVPTERKSEFIYNSDGDVTGLSIPTQKIPKSVLDWKPEMAQRQGLPVRNTQIKELPVFDAKEFEERIQKFDERVQEVRNQSAQIDDEQERIQGEYNGQPGLQQIVSHESGSGKNISQIAIRESDLTGLTTSLLTQRFEDNREKKNRSKHREETKQKLANKFNAEENKRNRRIALDSELHNHVAKSRENIGNPLKDISNSLDNLDNKLATFEQTPKNFDKSDVVELRRKLGVSQMSSLKTYDEEFQRFKDKERQRFEEDMQKQQSQWNFSGIHQVIGRAIRTTSHKDLPDLEIVREPPKEVLDPKNMGKNRSPQEQLHEILMNHKVGIHEDVGQTPSANQRVQAHGITPDAPYVTPAREKTTSRKKQKEAAIKESEAISKELEDINKDDQKKTNIRQRIEKIHKTALRSKIPMMSATPMVTKEQEVSTLMSLISNPVSNISAVSKGFSFGDAMETIAHHQNVNKPGRKDISTLDGFFKAVDEIKSEMSENPTRERRTIATSTAPTSNLDKIYIDPETGKVVRLNNSDSKSSTQKVPVQRASATKTNKSETYPVLYDEAGRAYYHNGTEYTPLIVEVAPDTNVVIQSVSKIKSITGSNGNRNNTPKIASPIDEETNNPAKQLIKKIDTKPNNPIPSNRMITPTISPISKNAPVVPVILTREQMNNSVFSGRGAVMNGVPKVPVIATTGVPNIPRMPAVPITAQRQPAIPAMPRIPPVPVNARVQPVQAHSTVIPVPGPPNGTNRIPMPQIPRAHNIELPQIPLMPKAAQTRPMTLTVTLPEEPLLPMPTENPYLRVPRPILDNIAQERDIHLTGITTNRARELFEYDTIMPDWIQSILSKNVENFQALTETKLFVFGAIHRVDFTHTTDLQNRDLIHYIRIAILINYPNHPGRTLLPTLIGNLTPRLLQTLCRARFNLTTEQINFVGADDMRTALINGNTNNIQQERIAVVVQRYNLLRRHKYSVQIGQLYSVDATDEGWNQIARAQPHPMEQIILDLDKYTVGQIVSTFGMSIPLSHAGREEQYVRNNIVSYAKILTRGILEPIPLEVMQFMNPFELAEYLSKLTDSEIFERIGIYVPYNNRNELVTNVANSFHRNTFMYPTIRSLARSHNEETILGSEITDIEVFMVCFGNALKYYTYELEELTNAFHRADDTRAMEFRRPENIRTKFTMEEIESLMQLLRCFEMSPGIVNLSRRIEEGVIDAREKITGDDNIKTQLNTYNPAIQGLVRDFVRQIFYTGMYMRRWLGPGHPFPVKADETRGKEPDAKVTEHLGIAIEILKQIQDLNPAAKTMCMNFKLCEYRTDGGIEHGNVNFRHEWNRVILGEACIRMASTKFIGTGYHYLRILFRETIPGLDVKGIDHIT